MRRGVRALTLALVITLVFTIQGIASASSGRIKATAIGMDAPIVKVGLKEGGLAIGKNLHSVFTWKHGDPPCDPSGTTVYAGHAWDEGEGVADEWGKLHRGDTISLSDCKFKVTEVQYWSAKRSIKKLFRVDGSPRIVLIGCKPDDYSKRTMVFAHLVD